MNRASDTSLGKPEGAASTSGGALLVVLLILSLALYRPWINLPFEQLDFAEFVPILSRHDSFVERLAGLSAFYEAHGRFIPLALLLIDVKWTLFGDWAPGWQWMTWITMAGAVVLGYELLIQLGVRRLAAIVGAGVYVLGWSAAAGWLRPHLPDPLGLVLVIAAALAALRAHAHSAVWGAARVALLLVGAILARETLVTAVPFVTLLALCHQRTGWTLRPPPGRSMILVLAVGAATLACAFLVLSTRLSGASDAYAANYTMKHIPLSRVVVLLHAIALPGPDRPFVPTANAILVAVVVGGGLLGLLLNPRRLSVAIPMAGAALYLTAGILAFLPWPFPQAFYGVPYLVGQSVLLGVGVDQLFRFGSPTVRCGTTAMVLMASLIALPWPIHQSRWYYAKRTFLAETVTVLSAQARASGASGVAVPYEMGDEAAWIFQTYARGVARTRLPVIRSIDCAAAQHGVEGYIVLVFATQCSGTAAGWSDPTVTVAQRLRTPRPPGLPTLTDSLVAYIWAPAKSDR